jgi:hypothetical protein
MWKVTVLILVLTLSACTSAPEVSLVTPEIPTLVEPEDKLPPISGNLVVPCYDDLKPVVAKSDSLQDIMNADVVSFEKVQQCYLRQYNLILEVNRRVDN